MQKIALDAEAGQVSAELARRGIVVLSVFLLEFC